MTCFSSSFPQPRVGKFYRTIKTPDNYVVAFMKNPFDEEEGIKGTVFRSLVRMVPSWELVMVVQSTHPRTEDINDLFYKCIWGEEFVWIHPYDLVEVDSTGVPITPKGF